MQANGRGGFSQEDFTVHTHTVTTQEALPFSIKPKAQGSFRMQGFPLHWCTLFQNKAMQTVKQTCMQRKEGSIH